MRRYWQKTRKGNRLKAERCFSFTLLEMLMVASITAMLISMLLPVVNLAGEKVRSISCINNLKQSLAMLQMYSIDYTEIPIKYYSKALQDSGYINENALSLICPDWSPRKELGDHHQVYGMRQTQAPTLSLVKAENPSIQVLLADTIRLDSVDARDGMKQYFTFYGSFGPYKNRVHCRHNRKANIGFMDGHVKPCSGKELEELKCPKYCYCPDFCPEHEPL